MPLPVLREFEITSHQPLAEGMFTLTLRPIDGGEMFAFQAGQWVMLHLLNADGSSWAKAAFSIASAPIESKESLELAIKMYGDFTRRADRLCRGDRVKIQGPYGVFHLRPSAGPLVLIGAGIGITPLRSMLRQLLITQDARQIVLLYTNQTRAMTAYEEELRALAAVHSNFHPIFFLTREPLVDWEGECGRISEASFRTHVPRLSESEYFACGPREFMESLKLMLIANGVDVKSKFHQERFS